MTDLETVIEAQRRIEAGEPLNEKQAALIKPMFKILEANLKPNEIPRFKHISGGYLIGPRFFPEQNGFGYIQQTLQQLRVQSIVLWSGGSLGNGGALLGPVELGLTDYDESRIDDESHELNPYQTAEPQEIFSVGMAQKMLARIDELRCATSTPERESTIQFLEGELRQHRYKRNIKSFDDEKERARKAVERSITRAITKLIGTPDTQDIGLHLEVNISTGEHCEYKGNWKWKF